MSYYNRLEISSLVGKTITEIHSGDDSVTFETSDGKKYSMQHEQNCCESVYLEDINGELEDLVGSPLIMAEESTNTDWPKDKPAPKYSDESYLWTFYRLQTAKGLVVLRFYGSSNGYYSEGVDLIEIS